MKLATSRKTRWSIVVVHYQGDTKTYRAVKYNEQNHILDERSFAFYDSAEKWIEEQQ